MSEPCFENLLSCRSDSMRRVQADIHRLARGADPVLIVGEPGVGKEQVARALHRNGGEGVFRVVWCPACSEEQVAKALPSGTDSPPGALLLQECGELSLAAQNRLLQWMLASPSRPPRLIATTSANLQDQVGGGQFLPKLFYRLASEVITVPPLRSRQEELPDLILSRLRQLKGEGAPEVSAEAMRWLTAYRWPGNLDELTFVLKRCLADGGGVSDNATLREALGIHTAKANLSTAAAAERVTNWRTFTETRLRMEVPALHYEAMNEAESQLLQLVLEHTGGNQSEAARLLGIARTSLRKKLRALKCRGASTPGTPGERPGERTSEPSRGAANPADPATPVNPRLRASE